MAKKPVERRHLTTDEFRGAGDGVNRREDRRFTVLTKPQFGSANVVYYDINIDPGHTE